MNRMRGLAAVLLVAVTTVLTGCPRTPNECGGNGALDAVGGASSPGAPCGPCGDGVAVCQDEDHLECVSATPANVCGGCQATAHNVDETCGACGETYACNAGALVCSASQPNACGGCATLSGQPGRACALDGGTGIQRCTGPDETTCVPPSRNACNGTMELTAVPGEACGACGLGTWTCNGSNAVTCRNGELGLNACGACTALEGRPGTACGTCGGTWECADQNERVTCNEPVRNACGGCSVLPQPPGAACGNGGVSYCDTTESVACGPRGGNACGGTGTLENPPGASCGVCGDGVTVCAAPDRTACAGASALNACGGCGFLPGVIGERCAPRGSWACSGTDLVCQLEPGANACGGSTSLAALPGTPCGTCNAGAFRCSGYEAVVCVGGEDAASFAYADSDGDGHGNTSSAGMVQCTLQSGYSRSNDDCDDGRAATHPGAPEVCNTLDDNCDNVVDNNAGDAATWYADVDGDGYGAPGAARVSCAQPANHVTQAGDCDDADARFHPTAAETNCADPADYNCDGQHFPDADGDGWGACVDCDNDPNRNPGVRERCDNVDNDCNGDVDDGDAVDAPAWHLDADGDGYGVTDDFLVRCTQPPGRVVLPGDCNDADRLVHPAATESCDHVDNNCDGLVDPGSSVGAVAWGVDLDGDGYGDDAFTVAACWQPDGFAPRFGDCNDRDPAVHPWAMDTPVTEVCDFQDNDCDGTVDNADPVAPAQWFVDADLDGYGDAATVVVSCVPAVGGAAPAGRVLQAGDCNDRNIRQHPGAAELVGDGIDQDCDGTELCFADADSDGHAAELADVVSSPDVFCRTVDGEARYDAPFDDCADLDPARNPAVAEVAGNNADDDCDGFELCFSDVDQDGFRPDVAADPLRLSPETVCSAGRGMAAGTVPQGDCNDGNASVFPGAVDPIRDVLDRDCDGFRGSAANTVFISAASGTDGPGCGPRLSPCATFGAAWRGPGDYAIEDGTYDVAPITTQGDVAWVGGFCPGTAFLNEGCADMATILRATDPAFLLRSGGAASYGCCGCGCDVPGHGYVANVELRAAAAPPSADAVAASSTLFQGMLGEYTFEHVRLVGGRGGDNTAAGHGGSSIISTLSTYTVEDQCNCSPGLRPFGARVELVDADVVLGRGGDAVAGTAQEGGPVLGMLWRAGTQLLVDAASVFRVGVGGGGGQPGGTATARCPDGAEGSRCFPRLNRPAREFPVLRPVPDTSAEEVFSIQNETQFSLYTLVRAPAAGIAQMTSWCSAFDGATLVVFDRTGEEDEVTRHVAGLLDTPTGTFRVGLLDPDHDGAYGWADGSTPTASAWAPGEPTTGTNARCTRFTPGDTLAAESCEGPVLLPALCEAEPATTCTTTCPSGSVCCTDPVVASNRACFPGSVCPAQRAVLSPDSGITVRSYELLAPMTADAARSVCEASGRNLVEIGDAVERSELLNRFVIPGGASVWTGYANRGATDAFVWPSGASTSIIPFAPGEPADVGRGRQLFISYDAVLAASPDHATLSSHVWRAGKAYNHLVPFVCERSYR